MMSRRLDPIHKILFLEGIYLKYGYDFRDYSSESMERRILRILADSQERSLLSLLDRVLSSKSYFQILLPNLTVNTTFFFRDLKFFKDIKQHCFPLLESYPSLKIWIAGCSSGEEIVSLAILLKEAGLYDRTTIYATDISPHMIEKARRGVYKQEQIKQFIESYNEVSAETLPSNYYTFEKDGAKFNQDLYQNVIFLEHNLVSETMFERMHVILCRNVMIYFNKELQNNVIDAFTESLVPGGILGLGTKESLMFYHGEKFYKELTPSSNIYQLKPNFYNLSGSDYVSK